MRNYRSTRRSAAVATVAVSLLSGGLALMAEPATAVTARTFHLSPSGNDKASGLSPSTAWKTLNRANKQAFTAGDRVLLEGGKSFAGMLYFDAGDKGTLTTPVKVATYGIGKATIAAAGTPGIYAYNTAGLDISNLTLVGNSSSFAAKGGFSAYSDLVGQRRSGIKLTRLDVRGFNNGIEIGGRNAGSGFSDVTVTDSVLSGNRETGMITYGPTFNASAISFANANVNVLRVTAHSNLGDPNNLTRNTGNGIVLGSVNGASIRDSRAYNNGGLCKAPEGPAGIWTYDSNAVTIAGNISYSNRTGGPADGDGFDLDQNVSNSVMEWNTSYDNDGAGYLVYTGQNNTAHHDNVVRYNTSDRDSKKNAWYGGVTVVGKVIRTAVYGNDIDTTGSPVRAPAIALDGALSAVTVNDNSLTSVAAAPVVTGLKYASGAVAVRANRWSATTAQPVRWGTTYASVAAWGTATGSN